MLRFWRNSTGSATNGFGTAARSSLRMRASRFTRWVGNVRPSPELGPKPIIRHPRLMSQLYFYPNLSRLFNHLQPLCPRIANRRFHNRIGRLELRFRTVPESPIQIYACHHTQRYTRTHPMAPEAQTNANRENAEKSTGPRTPQGKAISSRNSLVHGMTSGKFLPPDGDPDEFFQLLDQFRGRFQPFDEAEDALVERLVAAEFKMRSVRYADAALFHIQAAEDPMLERYKQEGRTNLLAWAFHSDAKYSNSFSKLIRLRRLPPARILPRP